ncbi:MAG: polyprenyl synthetase family protein, partial [Phycisphaerales bacterium]
SGASVEVQHALERFGEAAGIAFQIQDDLLDLAGDPEVVGKTLGRDLEKGKMTLPAVLLFAAAGGREREVALSAILARDAVSLRALLEQRGAVDAARARAASFVEDAKRALEAVPDSPARELLRSLADAVVARSF